MFRQKSKISLESTEVIRHHAGYNDCQNEYLLYRLCSYIPVSESPDRDTKF